MKIQRHKKCFESFLWFCGVFLGCKATVNAAAETIELVLRDSDRSTSAAGSRDISTGSSAISKGRGV